VQNRISKIEVPKGWTIERALIAPMGVEASVREFDFFHHIMTLDEMGF